MNKETGELSMEELEQVMAVPVEPIKIDPTNTSYRKEAIEALKETRKQVIEGSFAKNNSGKRK